MVDSLLLEITQRPNDTLKIQAFNELAWQHIEFETLKARDYAKKAIDLSKKLNYERGELEGLNRLGTIAFYRKEYDEAINLYENLLKKEKKIKYQYGIGRAQNQLSNIYYKKGDLDRALEYAQEGLKTFSNIKGKDSQIAKCLSTIGTIYTEKGKYEEAINSLLRSLEIRRKLKDESNIAKILSKLGILNISINEYSEAKEYLIKSLAIYINKGDEKALAQIYNNLGIVAYNLGDYNNAKNYYDKSFLLKTKLDLAENDWALHNNYGALHFVLNDLESALSYFLKAQQILKKQNIIDQTEISLNIGNIFHRQRKCQEAIIYYEEALKIVDRSKSYISKFKILNDLQLCYREIGEFEEALIYSQRSLQVSDSLTKEKRKAIRQQDDYKKQIDLLEKDNKIKEADNKFKSILNYSFAIGLILFALLFFAIMRNKKHRQKIKLAEQQTEIEKQKATVAIQNQEIERQKAQALLDSQELRFNQARLEGQEKERTRIAKDLHDRLGSMLSMVKVHYKSVEEQLDTLKDTNQKQYEKANTLLDEACEEVRKIANDINSGTLSKFGLIAALEDLTLSLNETEQITADLNIHGVDNPLDADTEIEIYRIIQELIHNVLKHAFAKEVSIQLLQSKKGLNIIVEDDGAGFVYNTQNITGMGLKNVASRVEKLEGDLQVDSTPNNGTTIMIDIPINDINV